MFSTGLAVLLARRGVEKGWTFPDNLGAFPLLLIITTLTIVLRYAHNPNMADRVHVLIFEVL